MIRQWLGWKYALLAIGLVVLTLLVMDFNSRMAELRRLSDQRESVAAQVTELVKTQLSLETQIAYATSEAAVFEWAYQEGRLARPGDNPIVPLSPPGSTPQVTPAPEVVMTVESNWRIWLSLFVDPAR
jgi:hypothetical protein